MKFLFQKNLFARLKRNGNKFILFFWGAAFFWLLHPGSVRAEEAYEIMIQNIVDGTYYEDTSLVEEAINEITLPAINCTVKIENVYIDDCLSRNQYKFQHGEKMDLVCSINLNAIMNWISGSYLIPLDNLLDEYGEDLYLLLKDDLEAMRIRENIYTIPMKVCHARSGGIIYNKEMAEEYNILVPSKISLEELNTLFAEVKAKIPGVYATTQGIGVVSLVNYFYTLETFGYSYCGSGVILDESGTEIQNFYETELCREYYRMLRTWVEAGYMTDDTMTAGRIQQDYMNQQEIFCLPVYYEPSTLSREQSNYSFQIGVSQITEAADTTSSLWDSCWGISCTSQNPAKVMQFLNLLYTNSDIANLLNYGIEDIHYRKLSDHIIAPVTSHNELTSSGYKSRFSVFGNLPELYFWTPATESCGEECIDFQNSASRFDTLGYTFDIKPVQLAFTAVSDILAKYLPPLECGMVEDVDSAIDQLSRELKQAGIDQVLSENQIQLNTWCSKGENYEHIDCRQ